MSNFSAAGSSLPRGQVILLKDVVVPDFFYKKIRTTSEVIDKMFGGEEHPGILRSSITLTTGFPGAGKTTMVLQLADLLSKQGFSVLYNIGEENEKMVKMAADRLGIDQAFPISKFIDVDALCKYVADKKVEILIQDSLQSLDSGQLQGNKLLKGATEKLVELSKDRDVTVFLVGHITKGGDFAGPQKIKHDVDVHMHLSINKDTGNRVLEIKKNRFGPAMQPYEFSLGARGLDFQVAKDVPEQVTRAAGRKDETMKVVKKLLLAGKKLSGYSHESEPEIRKLNISGGFMRAILRLAANELASEGCTIKTETIDRREHVYVED